MAGGMGGGGDSVSSPSGSMTFAKGGEGGAGYTGQPGTAGGSGGTGVSTDTEGGGGGGGGAGGGTGGGGGGIGGGAGGAGGISGSASSMNGMAGTAGTGSGGGGGGGGGFNGQMGATLPLGAFVGGTGGAGGAGGPTDQNGGGGGGGAGGYGAVISGPDVTAEFSLAGGAGGTGGSAGGTGGFDSAGGGGDGGTALLATAATSIMIDQPAKLMGGAGGTGMDGGHGGAGLVADGSGVIASNAGGVTAGAGAVGSFLGTGGSGGAGVAFMGAGANLTNQKTGTITGGAGGYGAVAGTGGAGVAFASGGVLSNAGTITGGAGGSSPFTPGTGGAGVSGAGLTIVDTGAIAGGAGGAGTGEASPGAMGDAITFTSGMNTLSLGTNAGLEGPSGLNGAIDIKAGTPTEPGTLIFDQSVGNGPGTVNVSAPIIGAGAVVKNSLSTLTLSGANTFAGGTTIDAGTLQLATVGSAGTKAIAFAPASGDTATLALESGAQPGQNGTFANTLANFGVGARLDIEGVPYVTPPNGQPAPQTYDASTGTLEFDESGTYENFKLSGVASGETFYAESDGNGGSLVFAMVCFATGTSIRTARGEIAVEALQVGDLAVTASGALRPIRWIGQRTIDCAAHPVPSEAWPVRVLAGAFGAGLPERDLYLSPGHPVLVGSGPNDVLVPIMCLINGTSIARAPVAEVTYWHVELDEHDILLAEGLPAESFLDWGNRPWFADSADHALLHPDFVAPGLAGRCRPVAIDGAQVEAERRRIDTLFALRLAGQCAWPEADGDDAWMM